MSKYIFTKTSNTSRGGLMASFPLWSIERFIKELPDGKKDCGALFRYGCVGGYMNQLKEMDLAEFESIFCEFGEQPFTKDQITMFFRKEISLKYGHHKEKSEQKFLKKRDIVAGKYYTDHNGCDWLYLGEVEQTIDKMAYRSNWDIKQANYKPEVNAGHGFLHVGDLQFDRQADRVTVLKTMKKFVSEQKEPLYKFEIPESLIMTYESGQNKNGYRWHERIVTIKIFR